MGLLKLLLTLQAVAILFPSFVYAYTAPFEYGYNMSEVIVPAVAAHTATIIFVHGLGDSGTGWAPLANQWRLKPAFENTKFILPNAPKIKITLSGTEMPAWFDIVRPQGTTPFTNSRADQDEAGTLQSRDYLLKLIQGEIDAGIPPSRIILGGFSQGGVMSLFTAVTAPMKLGGFFGLSCFLPLYLSLHEHTPANNPNKETCIFMGHGDRDQVIKLEWAQQSEEILRKEGWNVDFHIYKGMPHSTVAEEIKDLEKYLTKALEVDLK